MKTRTIDRRYRPNVRGIDLWQAMNYIALEDASLDFVYDRYTSSTTCHVKGSHPALEKLARRLCRGISDPMKRVAALARHVAEEVHWAGYHERDTGRRLPGTRNATEERILRSRYGWCMEQARLLCVLCQVCDIPARLVFACNRQATWGHVVTETLVRGRWMLVDQSFGYCFVRNGRPVRAWDVRHVPAMAAHFGPIYRSMCAELERELGHGILSRDFRMAIAPNPLDGFERLGFCNHYV